MPCEEKAPSVLVLDPHKPSRQILLRYLQQRGMTGTEAGCYEEGKALLGEGFYGAVAFQCPLPDVDFVDVIGWLRSSPGLGGRLYLLAITSIPEIFSKELLLQQGVDDVLVKPVSRDDTCQALMRMQGALNC